MWSLIEYAHTLHFTALHCTSLPCTSLHYTALHFTILHCTALYCTALHSNVLQSEGKTRQRGQNSEEHFDMSENMFNLNFCKVCITFSDFCKPSKIVVPTCIRNNFNSVALRCPGLYKQDIVRNQDFVNQIVPQSGWICSFLICNKGGKYKKVNQYWIALFMLWFVNNVVHLINLLS